MTRAATDCVLKPSCIAPDFHGRSLTSIGAARSFPEPDRREPDTGREASHRHPKVLFPEREDGQCLWETWAVIAGRRSRSCRKRGSKSATWWSSTCGGEVVKGTVVPRYQYNDDSHVVIKLKSGYNVGISVARISSVKKLSAGEKPAFTSRAPKPREDLPEVAILGTGGTIASRVDYRTGAVHPAISSEDLYSLMPELSDIAAHKARDSAHRLQREPRARRLGEDRREGRGSR